MANHTTIKIFRTKILHAMQKGIIFVHSLSSFFYYYVLREEFNHTPNGLLNEKYLLIKKKCVSALK